MKIYYSFPQGKTKAFTLSYDDGKLQDKKLVSIFNKYGVKGTFNINYGLMDQETRISKEEVASVYQGHEVATHTMTHPTIERCPLSLVAKEILEDREGLEKLTNTIVRGHAYPNGSYSQEIKTLFQQLGIAYGRVVPSVPNFELPTDPLEWHPTCHHNDRELMEKAKWFVEFDKKQYLKLMYVWGHSYEFDDNDNWHVIEELCSYIGGKEEIWYATNIEIIEYMKVLDHLEFSATGNAVFNPSAKSAWIQINDEKILELKGGAYTMIETNTNNNK